MKTKSASQYGIAVSLWMIACCVPSAKMGLICAVIAGLIAGITFAARHSVATFKAQ